MVSSHGAVVRSNAAGRGSGFQGTRLLHGERRLSSLEEKDQMEAVR